ncbi:MAG: metallophosphoesterase family protein [Saprospiraceae bacterium]|jgi:putative phosphoesterase|nr:metallophosphoesterase family protein [Saprospiraceae bacterium]HQU95925.1 metallophosphoesterase family protein [Saprospiraceae bacterium]HQW96780.1 metallophosphoesterase family protein [Saprospiraceae bacterium]
MRVALLSDTHSHIDASWLKYFESCDEIWHAGDFGNIEVLDYLKEIKPVRAVWGNIDGHLLRAELPEVNIFEVEGMKVMMIHIGGYPGKYESRARRLIEFHRPGLFICGHSHILRVIYDKKYEMLTMNPGAAGIHGFHKIKTLLRFSIIGGKIFDAEVVELGTK